MGSLLVSGLCDARIFGLSPSERLARQSAQLDDAMLVANASAVLGDSTIAWLRMNPGKLLTTPTGTPLAICVPSPEKELAIQALEGRSGSFETVTAEHGPELFNKKLRRRDRLFGMTLAEHPAAVVERRLFDSVYKGVTDVVTKWVWPLPAFFVTRALARWRIPPNVVTTASIVLVFVAALFFLNSDLWAGLAAAWLMTFLDTVDGKLARVTATSSRLGNILDHGTDLIHPPAWWACLGVGLLERGGAYQSWVVPTCSVILATYLISRLLESGFRKVLGFTQFIWRPFDSHFRLVVARRNSILLIMTIGLAAGSPVEAYIACAAWSIVSVGVQAVRFSQALRARPILPWLAV